ncbi:hypothetical protein AVEN_214684-1 [Araneus ventricosus]|uniref:Uncharacterized protein n=1 Tax=Araneus ventricosus TaxID=182803 RepID=A0A4Y2IZF5_ARAVE|nr:hypothetical protein AVEN_214684-1 [Araneus ventricosus]
MSICDYQTFVYRSFQKLKPPGIGGEIQVSYIFHTCLCNHLAASYVINVWGYKECIKDDTRAGTPLQTSGPHQQEDIWPDGFNRHQTRLHGGSSMESGFLGPSAPKS